VNYRERDGKVRVYKPLPLAFKGVNRLRMTSVCPSVTVNALQVEQVDTTVDKILAGI
jgi:hypothetical protein